jgi:thymidylate synthase (FAD)
MEVKVLDHGYVKLIESWGTGIDGKSKNIFHSTTNPDYECGIIEAARQSTQGSFRGWDKDEKLLKFMFYNNHSTPFEFAGMIIEVQAPIFIFREWHRHRTQSYNEMSARYAPLPDLNYVPDTSRIFLAQNNQDKNTQAKALEGTVLDLGKATAWQDAVRQAYKELEYLYQLGLDNGIPKELARIILPVGRYSRMRASTNLRNWLAFLTLRMAPNAQWEIRQYANAVGDIISQVFPKTWELFKNV